VLTISGITAVKRRFHKAFSAAGAAQSHNVKGTGVLLHFNSFAILGFLLDIYQLMILEIIVAQ